MSAHSVAKRYKGLLTETPTDMPGMVASCLLLGEDRKGLGCAPKSQFDPTQK